MIDQEIEQFQRDNPDVSIEKISAGKTEYVVEKDGVSVTFNRRGRGSWVVRIDFLDLPTMAPEGLGYASVPITEMLNQAIDIVRQGRESVRSKMLKMIDRRINAAKRRQLDLESLRKRIETFESDEDKFGLWEDYGCLMR